MNEEPLPVESAAARILAKLDDEIRTGRRTATSETADASNSGEALLWQLERRWPRRTVANGSPTDERLLDTPIVTPLAIGPYVVSREIGRGGYGVVMLARDERHGFDVALKIPRADLLGDPAARERFRREAEAMASISHPGIVQIHEVGRIGELDFIASQYCPEGSLADRLVAGETPFTPVQSAELVRQLAHSVEHMHSLGMLHRDLKPSNVLLAPKSEENNRPEALPFTPLVTDFGLAKLIEQSFEQTGTSVMLGTPLYMAPEQAVCAHHRVGPTTDVYSLGVILYELLAGRPPFVGPGLLAVLHELQTVEPMPLRRARPDVPHDLEQICLKCLAKDQEDRYQSAAALEAELMRFLDGTKVQARRPGWGRQFQKWRRRPERITSAGIFAIFFNAAMLLWAAAEVPYIWLSPNVNVDRLPVISATFGMAFNFMIPLLIAGIFTLARRRWAAWMGLIFSFLNFIVCVLGATDVFDPFGNLYHATPLLRVIMFGLIGSLTLFETFLFATACTAMEHLRRQKGSKS